MRALRCVDGRPLVEHRRKTFIIGFIVSAKSAEKLALDMLENSYSYFLTYKVSQDHLELLFACIRGKNGYNNNPDVRIFKSALKRLMLRNSIVASKNANCAMLEENDFNPIFSLKWSKNRAPLEESNELDENNDTDILPHVTQLSTQSPYQVSILAYIAGFIVRTLKRSLDCEFCFRALELDSSQVPNYAFDFIILKNRGGLVFPSNGVLRILKAAEVVGGTYSFPSITAEKKLILVLQNKTIRMLPNISFPGLSCDFENEFVGEDIHSYQPTKEILHRFFELRLIRYGQHYTEMVIQKGKCGLRQK